MRASQSECYDSDDVVQSYMHDKSLLESTRLLLLEDVLGNFECAEKGRRYLDVGCGIGENLRLLSENPLFSHLQFESLCGIDNSNLMISAATNNCKALTNISFLEVDFTGHSAFLPSDWDVVFCQAFIHLHYDDTAILRELLRLASSGVLYLSSTIHALGSEGMEEKDNFGKARWRRRYTKSGWMALLERCADRPYIEYEITDPKGKVWSNAIFFRVESGFPFAMKRLLSNNGWCPIYRLFCGVLLDKTIEVIDNAARNCGSTEIMRYEGSNHVFDRVENVFEHDPSTRDILEKLSFLLRLYGDYHFLKDKTNFKPPGSGQFPPHQDAAAGWFAHGDSHLTLAVSLDPANRSNGGLEFANGPWIALYPENPLAESRVSAFDWQVFDMKRGDAVLFSSLTPHRSAENRSLSERKVAFLTYVTNPEKCIRAASEMFQKEFPSASAAFFAMKRHRQPTMDDGDYGDTPRDAFGKIILS